MIIDRNCSCMNSGDRCYERLLFIHETCWSSNISWSLGGTSFKHLSSRFWSDFSPLLLWLLMQHLQYPVLGSSEEIESEFESKWLDDSDFFIHCHNFSDWSLTVLTYSVLVVSLCSSLSFASLDLNPLSHSSPWNGKFWLKSFGPIGSSSRRLNPFAKTWLTLPFLIDHWPVS